MKARQTALALALALLSGLAAAKLPAPPPLTDEQKVKADEAKAKAAEAAKKEAELLAKWQDIAAQKYAAKLKAEGKEFKPTPMPAPVAAVPATPAATSALAATQAGKPTGK